MEGGPGDYDPQRLKEACEIVFRGGTLDHSRVLIFWTGRLQSHRSTRYRLGPAVSSGACSRGSHLIDAHDHAFDALMALQPRIAPFVPVVSVTEADILGAVGQN
jgi:hypothetical protein